MADGLTERDVITLHLDTGSSTESSGKTSGSGHLVPKVGNQLAGFQPGLQKPAAMARPTDDEGGLGDDDVFEPMLSQVNSVPPVKMVSQRPSSLVFDQSKAQPTSGSPETDPGQIGILEKIVRSHPIWYLPHMPRTAATHLLRNQEVTSGVFVIRQSSKPHSMALSLRLPPGHNMDTDHYLIETTKNGIRLEGSPNFFASLPFLLEYYCENGEEIQTKLCLPPAVMDCQSRRDLHSLALMGQDFWSSYLVTESRSESQASRRSIDVKSVKSSGQPEQKDENMPPTTMKKSESAHAKLISDGKKPTPPIRPSKIPQSVVAPFAKNNKPLRSESISEGSIKSGDERRSFRLKNWLFSSGSQNKKSPDAPPKKNDYFGPSCCGVEITNQAHSVSSLLTQEQEAQLEGDKYWNTTPSLSRKRLHTFKPGSPEGECFCPTSVPSSANTTLERNKENSPLTDLPTSSDQKVVRPPVRPKPPAVLRREKSDLGWTPPQRPWHQGERESNSPVAALKPKSPNPPQKQAVMPPPKSVQDQTFKTCVEELRQKRLESAKSKLPDPQQPAVIARKDGSPHVLRRERNDPNENGLFGTVSSQSNKAEHRLSAPNLADVLTGKVNPAQMKWGRNAGGDLQTINEGLVTPVIRRKQFLQNVAEKERNLLRNQSGQLATDNVDDLFDSMDRKSLERDTLPRPDVPDSFNNHHPFARRYNSERSPRKVSAPVVGKPALFRRTSTSGADSSTTTSGSTKFDSTASKRTESPVTSSETNYQWVAVTNEFRNKQKVAKVNPYRAGVQTAPEKLAPIVPSSSEYAHLSEFSDLFSRDGGGPPQVLNNSHHSMTHRDDDNVSVAGTVFNEPWDSSVWENLIDLAQYGDNKDEQTKDDDVKTGYGNLAVGYGSVARSVSQVAKQKWKENNLPQQTNTSSSLHENRLWNEFSQRVPLSSDSSPPSTVDSRRSSTGRSQPRISSQNLRSVASRSEERNSNDSDKFQLGPALTPPRLKHQQSDGRIRKDPSTRIQEYIEKLSQDKSTVFGATIQQFIDCTHEAEECDPTVVIRNVRQFLNGIKNYLVKHGEGQLHALIERERSKLNATEFLNIDAMLEGVMHKIVLSKIKAHLYHLLIREQTHNGSLKTLSQNLAELRQMPLEEIGLKQSITPSPEQMDQVRGCLRKMQHDYSPLKKLENLLRAVSIAFVSNQNTNTKGTELPAADDLVRWLVYILCKCSVVGCDVEAIYMWDLLPAQLLNATASYYLTALFSAIHCIKNKTALHELSNTNPTPEAALLGLQPNSPPGRLCESSSSAFVRVAIPDEAGGSISYHTFPGVPQMTTAKLCRLIAHQCNVTNPEDHGLYLLVDGYETCLLSSECPDVIGDQLRGANKAHMFAYKRHEAKIAWPKVPMSPRL